MQLTHHDSKFTQKQLPVQLICDSLNKAANVGGIMRLADAFGLEKLYFTGMDVSLGRKVKKTSRSVEKFIDYEFITDIDAKLECLKRDGYCIIALEITANSKPLGSLALPINTKCALIIGNEIEGISDSLLARADKTIHIEMYGRNSSMNVVTSTAIALYELSRQLTY